MTDRRAVVQGERGTRRKPPGTISWEEHLAAWEAYARRYGSKQTAERIHERGGFGFFELTELLGHEPTTWEARDG